MLLNGGSPPRPPNDAGSLLHLSASFIESLEHDEGQRSGSGEHGVHSNLPVLKLEEAISWSKEPGCEPRRFGLLRVLSCFFFFFGEYYGAVQTHGEVCCVRRYVTASLWRWGGIWRFHGEVQVRCFVM